MDEISELPAETPFPPLAPEKGVTDRWQDWALLTPPSFSIPWRGTGAGDSHGWCLGKLGAAADLLVPSQQSPPARQAPVRGSSSELALDTDPTQPSPRPGQEGSVQAGICQRARQLPPHLNPGANSSFLTSSPSQVNWGEGGVHSVHWMHWGREELRKPQARNKGVLPDLVVRGGSGSRVGPGLVSP